MHTSSQTSELRSCRALFCAGALFSLLRLSSTFALLRSHLTNTQVGPTTLDGGRPLTDRHRRSPFIKRLARRCLRLCLVESFEGRLDEVSLSIQVQVQVAVPIVAHGGAAYQA